MFVESVGRVEFSRMWSLQKCLVQLDTEVDQPPQEKLPQIHQASHLVDQRRS